MQVKIYGANLPAKLEHSGASISGKAVQVTRIISATPRWITVEVERRERANSALATCL